MPRGTSVLAVLLVLGCAGVVDAQTKVRTPAAPVAVQASNAGGRIQGVVRDQAGQGIGGVAIVALGNAVAAATSERAGNFSLALVPGEYVLRATRDGYVSTYREVVSIHTSARLERNITMMRAAEARPVLIASIIGQAGMAPILVVDSAAHAHSDTAWRLRHLPRSALRDTTPGRLRGDDDRSPSADVIGRSGIAGAATSFFTQTDFSGQLNFITTSTVSATNWLPDQLPRGIAYLAVGAPVAGHGDWRVRGALTAGDLSSWTLLGEYDTHASETHAFHLGVSYSTQGYASPESAATSIAPAAQSRSVGSLYGFDRWQLNSRLAVDYGLRLDHFDYVDQTTFLSPRVGARINVLPRTAIVSFASQRTVAPGADEFLPPSSSGIWLPAERTFSTLVAGAPMRAERVRHYEVGIEHAFGDDSTAPRIGIRRFVQQTENQIATLFGFDETAGIGHYYVGTPGDVEVDGWAVRASGTIAQRMCGMIEYSSSDAKWSHDFSTRALRRLVPSAARRNGERIHDLTTTFAAVVPDVDTRLSLAYRFGTAFSSTSAYDRVPITDGRFEVEVRQPLPFQPIRGGRVEMLFAIRNLLRDPRDIVSIYDELLTVAPPMRMMGGLQVKF